MQVFKNSESVIAQDGFRSPTILITDMDGGSVLPNAYLIDFNTQISDDFQMIKTDDYTFQFLTFGRAPVFMTIGGVQPFSVLSEQGRSTVAEDTDIESYYIKNSLSSGSPKQLAVNVMAHSIGKKAGEGIYRAYMHTFKKLPSPDPTIQEYEFTIGLICWSVNANK